MYGTRGCGQKMSCNQCSINAQLLNYDSVYVQLISEMKMV